MTEFEEIMDAVNTLEQEIFEQTEGMEYFNIVATSNGFCTRVSFIGIELWNSEDDQREYIEDKDEYEPMETYLRRTINEELVKLRMISV